MIPDMLKRFSKFQPDGVCKTSRISINRPSSEWTGRSTLRDQQSPEHEIRNMNNASHDRLQVQGQGHDGKKGAKHTAAREGSAAHTATERQKDRQTHLGSPPLR